MKQLQYLSVIAIACFNILFAQTKTGTTIGQFLLIEPSAKISSLGNAGAALPSGAMSSYYNPAAFGSLTNTSIEFTYNSWFADILHNTFTASIKVSDASSVGLTMTSLNSGEISVRTVEQPKGTGEKYTVSDYSVGLGYGQKITDRFSAGAQISYIQETIWHSTLSVFAINFGTLYQITEDGLMLGASISNFGFRGKYNGRDLRIRYDFDALRYGDNSSLPAELITEEFALPIIFRVGFSYPLKIDESNKFTFVIDAFHPSDNSESISAGAEYTFLDAFSLRAGYEHLYQTDSEKGLTLGAGINWDIANYVFRLDYASNSHKRLGNTQRITLGLEF